MKQSNIILKIIPHIVLAVFLIAIYLLVLPEANGDNLSTDARYAYAQCIETEIVTDWHSALFMYEGIAIKRMASFFGCQISGYVVMQYMAIVLYALLFVGFAYLIWQFGKYHRGAGVLSVLVCLVMALECPLREWGLDMAFICVLVPLLACNVALYNSQKNLNRILLCVASVVLLWHCVEFRKNSYLLVPVMVFSLLFSYGAREKREFRTIILRAIVLALCFCAVFFPLVKCAFPIKQTKPMIPMMVSDVRIAYVLMGREDELLKNNSFESTYQPYDRTITAYYRLLKKGSKYEEFEDFYIQTWKEHTREMLVAKALQVMQFYFGGKTPTPIQGLVNKCYPKVLENPEAWKEYRTQGTTMMSLINRISPLMLMLALTLVAVYVAMRNKGAHSSFELLFILMGLVAIVYAASFMVVTPTPDDRYLMPSLLICKVMLAAWVIRLLHMSYFQPLTLTDD